MPGQAVASFTRARVSRGRFTIENTGDWRDFSLNPNDLQDTLAGDDPDYSLPGQTQGPVQAGAGGARLLKFTLRLDGDLGYRERRRQQGPDDVKAFESTGDLGTSVGLAVTDEIAWYEQFMAMGAGSGDSARFGDPRSQKPVILFSFGERYRGMRCVMQTFDLQVLQLTRRLEIMRADLRLVLKEKPYAPRGRADFYDPAVNRNF